MQNTKKRRPGTNSVRTRKTKAESPEILPQGKRATASQTATPVSIVGIGASAGGLEAFQELLQALPNDTGMAFVLVQHLAPKHESILSELLSKAATMPVIEVREGMAVHPNHVYVIPPNADMSVQRGVLHLSPLHRRHPFRNGFRWHARFAGDQGLGRRDIRSRRAIRQIQRHAPKRDRSGNCRFCLATR